MKLIKLIGVTAAAMLALTAFGVSVAAAEEHEAIGFCKEYKPVLCSNTIEVPSGGSLLALAESTNARLTGGGIFEIAEKCDTSNVTLLTKETDKKLIGGKLEELSFKTNCEPCNTVTVKGLPYNSSLTMEGEHYILTAAGKATLSGCPFGAECTFGSEEVPLLGESTESGVVFHAENEKLNYEGGSGTFLCGSSGTWNADYTLTTVHLRNSAGEFIGLHEAWLTLLNEA